MTDSTLHSLLGVLQRAITEARAFALAGDVEMAADLLDALDNLPRHLAKWTESSEQAILAQLSCFDDKYPNHSTRYSELFAHRRLTL